MPPLQLRRRSLVAGCLVAPLLVLTFGGCQTTVASLANGDGPLAKDAQAVLKALGKSSVKSKRITVWPDRYFNSDRCPRNQGCVGVLVRDQRIVTLLGLSLDGIDLRALSVVSELESVQVEYSKLGPLEGLEGLQKLKLLDFATTDCTRVAHLRRLPRLETLKLGCTSLREVEGLEDLPKLQALKLSGRQLTVLRGLKNLGLRTLEVDMTGLAVLADLSGLPELETISVWGNKLVRLELSNLPKLKSVTARKNAIVSVQLSKLPALRTLDLSDNRLVALPQVLGEALPAKDLRLSNNKIATLRGLEAFPELQTLMVDHNALTSLASIERAPQLERLYVSHNGLKTLAPLSLAKLSTLMATNNALADATEFFGADRRTRPTIVRYDLRGNPLTGVEQALLYQGLGLGAAPSTSAGNVKMGIGGYTPGPSAAPPTVNPAGPIRATGGRYSGGSGGYRPGK